MDAALSLWSGAASTFCDECNLIEDLMLPGTFNEACEWPSLSVEIDAILRTDRGEAVQAFESENSKRRCA